jgi:hypothetical protein
MFHQPATAVAASNSMLANRTPWQAPLIWKVPHTGLKFILKPKTQFLLDLIWVSLYERTVFQKATEVFSQDCLSIIMGKCNYGKNS